MEAIAKLDNNIFDELISSAKMLQDMAADASSKNKEEETEKKVKNNTTKPKKVETTLSSSEKTRYSKIGEVFFSSLLKKVSAMFEKEKRAQQMKISPGNDNSSLFKKLKKVQPENPVKKSKKGFGAYIADILLIFGGLYIIFKDKIDVVIANVWDFFKNVGTRIEEIYNSIATVLGKVVSAVSDFFNPDSPNNVFSSLAKLIEENAGTILSGLLGPFGGIVSFMMNAGAEVVGGVGKLFTAIVNVGGEAVSALVNALTGIGDALSDGLLGEIKGLFGGDENKVAINQAKTEVRTATENQIRNLQNKISESGGRDRALESQQAFLEESRKVLNETYGTKEEIERNAQQNLGVKIIRDGNKVLSIEIEDSGKALEAIKKPALRQFTNNYLDAASGAGLWLWEDEWDSFRDAIMAEADKIVKINNDGTVTIQEGPFEAAAKAWAEKRSDETWDDSAFVDSLDSDDDSISGDAWNSAVASFTQAQQENNQSLTSQVEGMNQQLQAEANAFSDRWKMIEAEGLGAAYRHKESMEKIESVTTNLQNLFEKYHSDITTIFADTISDLLANKLNVGVQLENTTEVQQDNSVDNSKSMILNIQQIKVEELHSAMDAIKKAEESNVETLRNQNDVLEEILEIIKARPTNTTNNVIVTGGGSTQATQAPSRNQMAAQNIN